MYLEVSFPTFLIATANLSSPRTYVDNEVPIVDWIRSPSLDRIYAWVYFKDLSVSWSFNNSFKLL